MLRTFAAIAAIVIFGMTADQACAAPPESESISADRLSPESVAPQHILIKIQMLEISRKKLESFNIERAIADDTDGVSEIIKHRINSKRDAIDMSVFKQTDVFRNLVTTLQKHQVAKVAANPNLVVVSGRRAAFDCADKYELPAATEPGKPVQFQTFGTRFDILATALANNNIRAELGIRKTEPDHSHAVAIGSNKVPTVRVRQLDTAFELAPGQSGLFTGPLPERDRSMRDAVTKANQKELVETWIIVTPELQASVATKQKTVR